MPRACATSGSELALESGIGADVRKALEAKGHIVVDGRGAMGGYQAIFIDPRPVCCWADPISQGRTRNRMVRRVDV